MRNNHSNSSWNNLQDPCTTSTITIVESEGVVGANAQNLGSGGIVCNVDLTNLACSAPFQALPINMISRDWMKFDE
ncbi:hypothetical protein N7489_010068 [Penicillium chrysogenum]|uniref:Uncharacterized protein n=1 Tax=Penicillium chrysogenum TaxID=5076 RepID=A0ABQ8WUW2_PENCH|nr:uncharacterized protein N7489_010068 [Penicillium chrysogenum]KAJ5229360.1 hypothetical protein N7489_010068 [Penicillium chrysogenum]KAJ5258764.1 hypothetical protein N7524_010320 [Penicillium chrysogenum]KAJ5282760.1 hypothetical protein N7505_000740 [Penicillium chrysogenum]KAJ6169234.1 hypothetical protein N7497_002077 [Penicillium chrysogenum]